MNNDEHLNVLSPPGDKSFLNDNKIENNDRSTFVEQSTVASQPFSAVVETPPVEVPQQSIVESMPAPQMQIEQTQFVEMPAQVPVEQVQQPVAPQPVIGQVVQPIEVQQPVAAPVMEQQVQPMYVAEPVQQMAAVQMQNVVPQPMPADPVQPVMPQQMPADPMQTVAPQPMVASPVMEQTVQPTMEQMAQPVVETPAVPAPEAAPVVQPTASAFLQQDEQHPIEEPQVYEAPESQSDNSQFKPFEYENKSSSKGAIVAVVIILAILVGGGLFVGPFVISLFSVSNEISNARDSSYLDLASSYIKSATNLVNEGKKVEIYKEDVLYLIPVGNDSMYSCVRLESGGMSPYSSSFKMAYVGVTYDNDEGEFDYFFTSVDGSGKGIKFSSSIDIANGDVSVEDISKYAVKLHQTYLGQESYEAEIDEESDVDIPIMEEYANVDKIIVLSPEECS